ncbi:hypothetical protein EJ04DRAFT_609777 [Polyplosphaeria fusca]|uniref:Uncharacterized protein n=1 Tax=Polyplosphaeria fusca TaxID=682080 RepID=A0A9P4QVW5_9PLEO|nr:hypothetical protein EJ04DRAFT_609777 [Polyplosphaeria fusca]
MASTHQTEPTVTKIADTPRFLALPVEIRVLVYEPLFPPCIPMSEVQGLVLLCKFLNREFRGESIRKFRLYLKHLEKEWNKSYPTPPRLLLLTQFSDLNNLTVTLPLNAITDDQQAPFLGALLALHLKTLKINFFDEGDQATEIPDFVSACTVSLARFFFLSHGAGTQSHILVVHYGLMKRFCGKSSSNRTSILPKSAAVAPRISCMHVSCNVFDNINFDPISRQYSVNPSK